MTAGLERGEWSAARPGRTLPPGKTRYPFYRGLGGPQGQSGRAKYLVPTGNRSRTVQPVVSRYTDRARRPTVILQGSHNIHAPLHPISHQGLADSQGQSHRSTLLLNYCFLLNNSEARHIWRQKRWNTYHKTKTYLPSLGNYWLLHFYRKCWVI